VTDIGVLNLCRCLLDVCDPDDHKKLPACKIFLDSGIDWARRTGAQTP
jgi:hypothetical protein